ncbi:hypothetical protein [Streptomyces sp. JJ38]|uniref:hypothetical protein n=1 Tax=Streptomyces sp. JJ38 TaxID=2738128 RepID=UPI001C575984|nr:hypothetical protein [Streptomyces sp. JJ38]MBW1599722.1 hypothetical protein [Streptomyces sp. JJ38]
MTENLLPEIGSVAFDAARERVGVVMGHVGPYIQLRPQRGGKEWDARPGDVRPATEDETLRGRVRETNERSSAGGPR